jgi:hypothetical protein
LICDPRVRQHSIPENGISVWAEEVDFIDREGLEKPETKKKEQIDCFRVSFSGTGKWENRKVSEYQVTSG